MKIVARIAVLLAVFLCLHAPAQAQDEEYINQVGAQLDIIETAAINEGWQSTHDYLIDRLPAGGVDSYYLELDEGWQYRIFSVCDEDCSDLDLALFDENGNEISVDGATDDWPVVEAEPAWTGKFELQVGMYRCSSEPCYYGIGVVGR